MADEKITEIEELFPLEEIKSHSKKELQYRSYMSSPFIAASLPLKDVKKNLFTRTYNNISLTLTSDTKVPFGKNGRLLLSILTTHAVLKKNKPGEPVVLEYKSLQNLLDELQLPKQRGKEIKEQLECFSGSTFVFKEKRTKLSEAYLFEEFMPTEEQIYGKVTATLHSTGIVPFFESMQYVDLEDEKSNKKSIGFKIVLSEKFTQLSQEHAVPINYTVYKQIKSVVGKDLYTWFVYRNNSIKEGEPLHISRRALVDQFMPVKGNKEGYESEERVNWNYLKEQINTIKDKYYPDLKVSINSTNDGITFYKSKPVIEGNDSRYMLVTSTI
ncbi:MAG: plasmid encoded RepA protein [Treponema sp.]|nr:plasmid encoded RepA protein [Treponema sp.]MBQ7881919.1 plasmid encoded RepA protein [Treponema sp.]